MRAPTNNRLIAAGYALKVPEGRARTVHGPDVLFNDKFDGVSVTVPSRPDTFAFPAGHAVEVTYSSNSEPDQVTGKKLRLVNEAVIFEHGAQHATLRVWAPLGADNVDQ